MIQAPLASLRSADRRRRRQPPADPLGHGPLPGAPADRPPGRRPGDRRATAWRSSPSRSYFAGGIETEEQLDAALAGIREECERLIGAGKKIVLG